MFWESECLIKLWRFQLFLDKESEMKNPDAPLCYNCTSQICASDKRCSACESPVFFDIVDQSVVEFMTEETHPNMVPRSDNG